MKLTNIISSEAINPSLSSSTRDDAISELLDNCINAQILDKKLKDDYFKKILKRERKGSTGIGRGVAIPHVKDPKIESIKIAIGVHSKGIDFNALDREPVQVIFLVLSPENKPEEHLNAMESIVTLLSQETFRRFIKQAKTIDDIATTLQEAEEGLI